MKHAAIFCTQPVHGTLYFFIACAGEEHFLFGQAFRPSLWNRYRFGVRLDDALDWAKGRYPADRKVSEKLFKSIPYIEKEFGLAILRKSRKTSRPRRREDNEIAA